MIDLEEYLDIVDEQDVVIGQAPHQEVHDRGLLHRFVQAFVVGSDGRILIQQRSRMKKRGALLFDAAVGGHVSSGETYDDAIIREGAEELGLVNVSYQPLGSLRDHTPPIENMLGRLYEIRYDGPFSGWEAEAERLVWMTPDELGRMLDGYPFLFTGPMPDAFKLWKKPRPI